MQITPEIEKSLQDLSLETRRNIVEMAFRAGKNSAHCGGSLSCVEILITLYHLFVRRDENDLENRDRVILSKAHASLAMYATLHSMGLLTQDELMTFEQNGSHYTAHAHKDVSKGLEFTGGSLGLGLSYATGVAYALAQRNSNAQVYVIVGDGECNEGIVWESLMFIKHQNLRNVTIIVDHNHLQADGRIEEIIDTDSLKDKFSSFGFYTRQVDGHSISALSDALNSRDIGRPNAIIAETIKGKGVSFMENKANWHFASLSEGRYKKAITELSSQE